MRSDLLVLLCAVALTGCSKCNEAPKKTSSNTETVTATVMNGAAVGDLRSGLIMTVPEFRGVKNLNTIAVLERTLEVDPADGGDLATALEPWFKDKRWSRQTADAGPLVAQQKPFFLEAERVNGAAVVRVGIVIPGEEVVKLLQSPAPLTTQQLSVLMPMESNAKVKSDVFIFEAHYFATDKLGTQLIKELIAYHVRSGWKVVEAPAVLLSPDSGLVASGFKAVLTDANATGTLTIGRVGEHNAVTWEQRLDAVAVPR